MPLPIFLLHHFLLGLLKVTNNPVSVSSLEVFSISLACFWYLLLLRNKSSFDVWRLMFMYTHKRFTNMPYMPIFSLKCPSTKKTFWRLQFLSSLSVMGSFLLCLVCTIYFEPAELNFNPEKNAEEICSQVILLWTPVKLRIFSWGWVEM